MQILTVHNAQSVRELRLDLILFEHPAVFLLCKISNAVFLSVHSLKTISVDLVLDHILSKLIL